MQSALEIQGISCAGVGCADAVACLRWLRPPLSLAPWVVAGVLLGVCVHSCSSISLAASTACARLLPQPVYSHSHSHIQCQQQPARTAPSQEDSAAHHNYSTEPPNPRQIAQGCRLLHFVPCPQSSLVGAGSILLCPPSHPRVYALPHISLISQPRGLTLPHQLRAFISPLTNMLVSWCYPSSSAAVVAQPLVDSPRLQWFSVSRACVPVIGLCLSSLVRQPVVLCSWAVSSRVVCTVVVAVVDLVLRGRRLDAAVKCPSLDVRRLEANVLRTGVVRQVQ